MTGGTPPVRSPLERGVPGGTAPGLHLPPAISNPYLLILTPTLTHPQYPAPISTMVLHIRKALRCIHSPSFAFLRQKIFLAPAEKTPTPEWTHSLFSKSTNSMKWTPDIFATIIIVIVLVYFSDETSSPSRSSSHDACWCPCSDAEGKLVSQWHCAINPSHSACWNTPLSSSQSPSRCAIYPSMRRPHFELFGKTTKK